jgi:adenosylcobinamide-phosphate synthase
MLSIVAAVLLDALAGDPYWFPHPVRLIGGYIKAFEGFARGLAKTPAALKTAGVCLTITTVAIAYIVPYLLLHLLFQIHPVAYLLMNILLMYTCLAARCLGAEAMKIYRRLDQGDLEGARKQTSMIVGRDTAELDESGITRAVVETVAENSSDGVLAPLLYMAIGGAPLAMAYKAINTLDSMVGYKNDRYLHFGWCSARLDDAANYLPARLTAVGMAFTAGFLRMDFGNSVRTIHRDGRNHSSPNSGYPEAAAAGAMGIQLGGTNYYFGKPVYKPTIGDAHRELNKEDIKKTILLMTGTYGIAIGLIGLLYWI